MRLLSASTQDFHEFNGSQIPPYAILSHRWEDDEVTFQDISSKTPAAKHKKGFKKVEQCCRQALREALEYVWVDTCCIDKSSSAELSEAINSMYRWYQDAKVCYAYLSDVLVNASDGLLFRNKILLGFDAVSGRFSIILKAFRASKWWTRGWTLQELVAPRQLIFFANNRTGGWEQLGAKRNLLRPIADITGIGRNVLESSTVETCSIAMRMSWAADRETTRPEDIAYCLLGIFGVNMPLLYGESTKAFLRLQEEIMKQSDDQSLFAWQIPLSEVGQGICGPLATSPAHFRGCGDIMPVSDLHVRTPYTITNKGLRIELPILPLPDHDRAGAQLAILQCSTPAKFPQRIGVPVVRTSHEEPNQYARSRRHYGPLDFVSFFRSAGAMIQTVYMKQDPVRNVEWWRTRLRIHILPERVQEAFYFLKYIDATPGMVLVDAEDEKVYQIAKSRLRGAVHFIGREKSFVTILFNIEGQHMDKIACRVIYTTAEDAERQIEQAPQQYLAASVISFLEGIDKNSLEIVTGAKSDVEMLYCPRTYWVDRTQYMTDRPDLLHSSIARINARRSFLYLPGDRSVSAHIEPQIINGERIFVLKATFKSGVNTVQEPYELDGSELSGSPLSAAPFAPIEDSFRLA